MGKHLNQNKTTITNLKGASNIKRSEKGIKEVKKEAEDIDNII